MSLNEQSCIVCWFRKELFQLVKRLDMGTDR